LYKAVFLDRDGVINDNGKPVNKPEDLKIFPWVPKAIKALNEAKYKVFIVTNQGGIELGYFNEMALKEIHGELLSKLNKEGAHIDDISYCPHFKTQCNCRKPMPGMLINLAKKHNIDLKASYMVGDRDVDILCGKNAGCKTIKIGKPFDKADYCAKNLLEAVKFIINDSGGY